jgi:hypothetical protein
LPKILQVAVWPNGNWSPFVTKGQCWKLIGISSDGIDKDDYITAT